VDNCYKKHGFPPSYGRTLQTNQASADEINDLDETRSYRGTESYGLTKDQYEKLVNLLQSSAGASTSANNAAQVNVTQHHQSGIAYSLSNSTYGSWIIDSGASDHICSSLSFYDKYQAIAPIQVKMANGSISYAKFSGTVKLFDKLFVHNVLLVPDFSLNLISVPKLTQQSQCNVVFNGVHCLIQERKSLRTIGSGELIEGLYYLTSKIQASNVHNTQTNSPTHSSNIHIPTPALWHFRLGHLSHSRLLNMKQEFPFVSVDSTSVCDICHLARHKRLPYKLYNGLESLGKLGFKHHPRHASKRGKSLKRCLQIA
jgi:hypothetical protein